VNAKKEVDGARLSEEEKVWVDCTVSASVEKRKSEHECNGERCATSLLFSTHPT
jgi:hypothetical protein